MKYKLSVIAFYVQLHYFITRENDEIVYLDNLRYKYVSRKLEGKAC